MVFVYFTSKFTFMKRVYVFVIAFFTVLLAFGQSSEKESIEAAIRQGNAKALGAYFASSVDLTVLQTEDVYSKDQAEVILTRFFNENAPGSFEIRHEGKSKLDDYYYIGELSTTSSTYRLTFFLKKNDSKFRIKQLRIESE